MTKAQEQERREAIERLREMLKPGDKVYTILRHVSRSGMQRSIGVVVHTSEGPVDMDWCVARALGWRFDRKNGGVKVDGCGMDMGFHLVYSLSYTLWPKGHGCIGKGCPSNDHSNGDRDYTPHGNGMTPHVREVLIGADHWHSDGGYALTQRWL